jgi:Fe(II)/alpha-ketoglutarate-dependent arginine beta-hydroxylase
MASEAHQHISELILSPPEASAAVGIAESIRDHYVIADVDDFLVECVIRAPELPERIRRTLADFRLRESSGACLLHGFPVDDETIGRTPDRWGESASQTALQEILLLLCASLLGDPISWVTQQDGAVIHDVLPIKGHEYLQINSASSTVIWWHTEEAFHPLRADYVGLFCLRNHDCVPTTMAAINGLKLDPETIEILMQPRFIIMPDQSHRLEVQDAGPDDGTGCGPRRGRARIEEMRTHPEKVPVLFGDPAAPYVRIDPYFMSMNDLDQQSHAALQQLIDQIDESLCEVSLRPGDTLFVDNFRAVHGRQAFQARYDGRDRWLKRVNLARDLRKSRSHRASAIARAIS